jgi:hypothetical protein
LCSYEQQKHFHIFEKSLRARKATKSLLKISTNANSENHISGTESTSITFSKFIKVNRTTKKEINFLQYKDLI